MIALTTTAAGARIVADEAQLRILPPVTAIPDWRLEVTSDAATWLPWAQLIEQGVMYDDGIGWCADWEPLATAWENGGASFLDELASPIPYILQIDATAAPGRPEFAFDYKWTAGIRRVTIDRRGFFASSPGRRGVLRIDAATWRLVEVMDHFNQLPLAQRSSEAALRSLAAVHDAAAQGSAYLADALKGFRVVIPDQLGLRIDEDEQGRVTFIPTCDGVDDGELQRVFLRAVGVRDVYTVDAADGVRVRMLLGERQREALNRMRAVRNVGGIEGQKLKDNPALVFEGLLDLIGLKFWGRVIGIGELPTASSPAAREDGGGFLDATDVEANGEPGLSIGASQLSNPSHEPPGGGAYLRVESNEEAVFTAGNLNNAGSSDVWQFQLPSALKGELKEHQRVGVSWLNSCRARKYRGVLLADDMGLGKTVQTLTCLASMIEQTQLDEKLDPRTQRLRWRPILIVAPLILLENETWQADMRRFFEAEGETFVPIHVLHGNGVDAARRMRGQDTKIGTAALDADFLMSHRVVITNYETLVNYQISLAQLVENRPMWSAIVTDEAQEYKSPSTRISWALKAINADFLIASTGTPVENRLLDLWNIVDTVEPGYLGSATDFSSTFERARTEEDRKDAANALRAKLGFGKPSARVLRRTKAQILSADLPKKEVKPLFCDMSKAEVDAHRSLLAGVGAGNGRGRTLRTLQELAKLYQHPFGDGIRTAPVPELLEASAKLRCVVAELRRIKAAGEKALIFARLRDVQTMLARVIEHELSYRAPVINGTTSSGNGREQSAIVTMRARESRQSMLAGFQQADGFGVCILSPFVAGTGLTITAANHVIHYGRWWNPAIEAQATDRAYRIGQTKPVWVYLPILKDPTGVLGRSFDELLHDLLERKLRLSDDFLVPLAPEEACESELFSDLLETQAPDPLTIKGLRYDDIRHLGAENFEALISELFARDGYDVVLTPRSGDGGADIIGLRGTELLLVQAKHSQIGASVGESGLMDLVCASDIYGNMVRARTIRLVLATNSSPAAGTTHTAIDDRISICGPAELDARLRAAHVTLGDVLRRVEGRMCTRNDLERWLKHRDQQPAA